MSTTALHPLSNEPRISQSFPLTQHRGHPTRARTPFSFGLLLGPVLLSFRNPTSAQRQYITPERKGEAPDYLPSLSIAKKFYLLPIPPIHTIHHDRGSISSTGNRPGECVIAALFGKGRSPAFRRPGPRCRQDRKEDVWSNRPSHRQTQANPLND